LPVRITLRVIGGLAALLGLWWVLQGTGLAPIGFMANQVEWAYRGAGLLVAAIVVIAATFIWRARGK
jgi:hypothetical protein